MTNVERWLVRSTQALVSESNCDVIPGIDLVHVDEFSHLIRIGGERFLRRQYTDAELDRCGGNPERLAARFAAKEATAKVLKTGFRGGLAARHIEVVDGEAGDPRIELHGPALARADSAGLVRFRATLTHAAGLAAAVVIAQARKTIGGDW